MRESKLLFLLLFFIFLFCRLCFAEGISPLEPISKDDRILILAPHPDDEAIACAGIIQDAIRKKAEVSIIYLTNGDSNQFAFIVAERRLVFRKGEYIHMGKVRAAESINAMNSLGLSREKLIFLGYPDFGTFTMFTRFWKGERPYKSLLARLRKVPYPDSFSYGEPFLPENILADLERLIANYRPTKIFVSHSADTNGDHRAFNLFLNIALWDLEGKISAPRVYSYLVHHKAWPFPRHYRPRELLSIPEDLNDTDGWLSLGLSKDDIEKKYQTILDYRSQTGSSAFYLLAFARENELFQAVNFPVLLPGKEVFINSYTGYGLRDDRLEVIFKSTSKEHDISRANIYLFGWRKDVNFSDMPKLLLYVRAQKFIVFDGRKHIKFEGITRERTGDRIIIRIPLSLINNPDRILASGRVFSNKMPFVQGAWQGLKLEKKL